MFQFSNSLNITKSIKVSIPLPVNFVVFSAGPSNNIATSNDGISWSSITNSALFGRGVSMSYSLDNNGSPLWLSGFAASNTNKISKSTDGRTWTSFNTTLFGTCYVVVYGKDNLGGNLWVASGTVGGNTFAYSTDGANWVGVGNQGVFPSATYDVAYGKDFSGNSLWVAVGQGASHSTAKSLDGKAWVGTGKGIFTTQGFSAAFGKDGSGNNLWVATGSGTNAIATSSDGTIWVGRGGTTIFTNGYNAAFGKDEAGNKLWVAVGQGANTIATSANGTTWTGRGNTIITGIGYGITYGNNIWVATGSGANTIATSTNGTTWTGLGNTIVNGTVWTSYFKPVVDISNLPVSYWLAFGPGATSISKSINTGISYTTVATDSLFSGYGYSAATNGTGLWIGTGSGTNTLAKSTDNGDTWSSISGAFSTSGSRLAYANNIFVVSGGTDVNIVVLNNSGTITNTYAGYFETYAWSVGFFKGKWYVGGTGAGTTSGFESTSPLVVSSDSSGTTWTKSTTSGLDTAINHIATNDTHIVISGSTFNSTMISTDAITWSSCTIGGVKLFNTGYAADYGNGIWIATGIASSGTNSIARSFDNGATWAYVGVGILTTAYSVAFGGNDTWIAVGTGATFNTAKSINNGLSWSGISNTVASSIYDIVNY